jgi:hypothetical protein
MLCSGLLWCFIVALYQISPPCTTIVGNGKNSSTNSSSSREGGARPPSGAVTTRTSTTSTPSVHIKDTSTINNKRAAVASSSTTTNKNEKRNPWVLCGSDSSEDENWPIQSVLRGVHQMLKSDSIKARMLLQDPRMRAGLERQDRIDEERCKAKEDKKRAASSSALPLVVSPSCPNKKLKATVSSDSRKPPNYLEDKDFLISCANVNVSVDPVKGVGEKFDTF